MLLRPLLVAFVLAGYPSPIPPITPLHVVAPFRAPEHRYSAGHRGVDLAAAPGQPVRSPVSGVIVFAGTVVDRPVLVVSDGRRRFSLEPVATLLDVGTPVSASGEIGRVSRGGHCDLRCVHVGLRIDGQYVNPLVLHARLIPPTD